MSQQPRVGVAVLIDDHQGRYLLGRRGRGPNEGKWVIPGGGIEWREDWRSAGAREVLEETGLTVRISEKTQPDYIMEIIGHGTHRVCLVVQGELDSWSNEEQRHIYTLKTSAELPTLDFFGRNELRAMHDLNAISPPVVGALQYYGILRR